MTAGATGVTASFTGSTHPVAKSRHDTSKTAAERMDMANPLVSIGVKSG
jgi:hypothetical protein